MEPQTFEFWHLVYNFKSDMATVCNHNYFVYILTNKNKTVLYIGVTNDLGSRLYEHQNGNNTSSFTYKYNATFLIFFERFQFIHHAIAREKELKGWRRSKKVELINSLNPSWQFLNDTIS
jgi:putative endonuclease